MMIGLGCPVFVETRDALQDAREKCLSCVFRFGDEIPPKVDRSFDSQADDGSRVNGTGCA